MPHHPGEMGCGELTGGHQRTRPRARHSGFGEESDLPQVRARQRRGGGQREGVGGRTRDGAPYCGRAWRRRHARERTRFGKRIYDTSSAGGGTKMTRILVVEDEPGIALGLEDDLTMEGYDVEVIGDGAVACRRARETPFDLILLDVMLPGKDGFEICRELRRAGLRMPI